MYIKEIIIDGFKSYAQRTVVSGFDPQFNAITGLNGSGKSNILDAICFVLGITNLTQVRAGSLQELIYKMGQAGVNRATVSLVFNNEDKSQSPIGYESHDEITITRQIVLGGKNKFLINGQVAQPGRVQNLFHSVQLNVNNPHFLIMQGRITKVLNMKPPEILSMIEEAAGTRMFETKKQAARKTMEKKESKLQEIVSLLNEVITPTLEKLRKERSLYLEYQKTTTEIEHLSRFVTAFNYFTAERLLVEAAGELESMDEETQDLKRTISDSDSRTKNIKQNIAIIEKKRDAEMGGALKDMEEQKATLAKELVKANTTWEHKKQAVQSEKANLKSTEKSIKELTSTIEGKHKEIAKATEASAAKQAEFEAAEAKYAEIERRCNGAAMGTSTDQDGADKTFAEQLKDSENAISVATTEIQKIQMRIDHAKSELKTKKPAAKESEKEYAKMQVKINSLESAVADIAAQLGKINYSEEEESKLQARKALITEQITKLQDKVDMLDSKLSSLQFTYSDPEKGWDRSKVKGLVAELLTVKNPATSTALEVTAGGRLFNVVVDDEVTGKKLLSNGKLQKRVTIVPLSKISGNKLSDRVVSLAKKEVGAENANVALSLVGYESEVAAAMEYVFGSTMICTNMEMAKKIAFNKDIRVRTVTLEGDVFDPSGTVTGGARTQSSDILNQLQELKDAREKVSALKAEHKSLDEKLYSMSKQAGKFTELKSQETLKVRELELQKKSIEQTTVHHIVAEVQALEKILEEGQGLIDAEKAKQKAAQARVKSIQQEMKNFESQREAKMKEAEGEKSKAKAAVKKAADAKAKAVQAVQELQLELEALQAELGTLQDQIGSIQAAIQQLDTEEASLAEVVLARKELHDAAAAELEKKREKLSSYENSISELNAEISALSKAKSDAELSLKKLEHKREKLQKDKRDAAKTVETLLSNNEWINSEKKYFGKEGTAFDFKVGDSERDPNVCKKRLTSLQSSQDKLSKNINMKVLSMFEKAEKEYNDLIKKKNIVETDKAKIERAIDELDEKKNEALKKAYEQVNRDFGSIFSTLLPGTKAKLTPVEGQSVLDGLEVKVAFGDLWKESLTELSGGQRSLVALSLILSLLLFKPAPLYILDEVDAALDLSHTQNIGQMLRNHFNKSQFVVVSLKDGMFNNANVLFKTKFVDGVSTVKRYAQSQSSVESESHGKENSAPVPKTKKARGAGGERAALASSQ